VLATISCRKHPHLQSTKTHSIRQYCGKQIQSHVWTILIIMTPNFLFLIQVESHKSCVCMLIECTSGLVGQFCSIILI